MPSTTDVGSLTGIRFQDMIVRTLNNLLMILLSQRMAQLQIVLLMVLGQQCTLHGLRMKIE